MSTSRNSEPAPGFSLTLGDVYFVIFRHKWKILILTALGLAAAAVFYFTRQPPYQAEAKLLVRYVQDNRPVNPGSNERGTDFGQSVLNAEMEIQTSFDLATNVAANVGPEKILKKFGGGSNLVSAASIVSGNLKLEGGDRESSVIHLTFQHPDPDLVGPVLNEIIADYQVMHAQIHRPIGLTDDMLNSDTLQIQNEIAQTEADLLRIKTNAGIVDVSDAEQDLAGNFSRIHRELLQAEAELSEHQAGSPAVASALPTDNSTNHLAGNSVAGSAPTNNLGVTAGSATKQVVDVPVEKQDEYQRTCAGLAALEKRLHDYLFEPGYNYTEDNKLVKDLRSRVEQVTKTKNELLNEYPGLTNSVAATPSYAGSSSPAADLDTGRWTALPQRVKALQMQLAEIQAESVRLNEAEAKISDLTRKKQGQEDYLNFFTKAQHDAKINETLAAGPVPNINVIQNPSPPFKDFKKFNKILYGLMIGGLLAGLVWAFAIEYLLDHSIKRTAEIQTRLRIPFFLSIPDLNQGRRRLAAPRQRQIGYAGNGGPPAASGITPPTVAAESEVSSPVNHALHAHFDALRDRLVNYFESINLTRKPKLVAVTSAGRGAGVSTIAAGLAASLSETGDGRVLLVDMNLINGAAQQFVHGKPGCHLDDALISEKRENALVQENLYVVSEGSNADQLPRFLPKRFAALVPKLKASDYDYIIFDMPPVSQTSITTRLAGFMDTVMLVIESEKSDRGVVQQATALLGQSKVQVTAVMNKTRTYVPALLQHDINADI